MTQLPPDTPTTTPQAPGRIRILVVDPDPRVHAQVARCLQSSGHQVIGSLDALSIESAGRCGYALLLMDPRTRTRARSRHGLDAWQRLSSLRDRHPGLPVIVLQRASTATDRTVAFELGADAVLDKPFDPRELRARVNSLLDRQALARCTPLTPQALLDRALALVGDAPSRRSGSALACGGVAAWLARADPTLCSTTCPSDEPTPTAGPHPPQLANRKTSP
jgi:DNA-binding response OmpR family regulator